MGSKNIIEINGRRYDAVSGQIISGSSPGKSGKTVETIIHPQKSAKATPAKQTDTTTTVKVTSTKPAPSKTTSNKPRTKAQHVKKSPQKSQVLMRGSVDKPVAGIRKVSKKTKPTIQKSQLGTSHRRAHSAKTAHKSPMIQKFEHPKQRSSVVKKEADLTVRQAPAVKAASVSKPAHTKTQHSQNSSQTANTTTAVAVAKKRAKAADKIIEAALANADAHEQKPIRQHKSKKRRRLSKRLGISPRIAAASTTALVVVLLAGFFAVQNVPNLAMRVAATRAGFDASMPGYQPSGFSFRGPINYSAGRVVVSFQSNTDDRAYEVVQQSSNWNSDALLANFIVENDKQYQTYLDKGRTLYIYDGSNATWVDDGVWYQVEGESAMTTDQLIRIASSF